MTGLRDWWAAHRCARGNHRWLGWKNTVGAVQIDWARNYSLVDITVQRRCGDCRHEDRPVFVRCWQPVEAILPVAGASR